MWVKREMERQAEGLYSTMQRLIQYGGTIEEFDKKLAQLNERASYMRTHVAAVLDLRAERLNGPSE